MTFLHLEGPKGEVVQVSIEAKGSTQKSQLEQETLVRVIRALRSANELLGRGK